MTAAHIYWTEQDDARLRELVQENLSYAEIGALMGRNKNSCIGRAHRIGIQREVKATHKKTVAKAVAKAIETLFPPKPVPTQDNRPPPPRYEQPEASTTAFGVPRSLMHLQPHHCRWPTSGERAETLFCCAKREGFGPYCQEHRLIAWRPTTRQLTTKAYR